MINKIDAVCLLVDDIKKAREFYENKLGLVVNGTDIGFIEFKLGETPLALFERKYATTMFPSKLMSRPGGLVLALNVDDVDLEYKRLKSLGITMLEEAKDVPWGQRVAYLHDPDGYIIEITQFI